jgi:DNA-binding HxlR family transcriptional regulator
MVDPAELFEAISHPERIKILKILSKQPSSFAALKRQLGIESSGNLDYHLKKLNQLVKVREDGLYGLTDAGKEALLSVDAIEMWAEAERHRLKMPRTIPKAALFLGLLELCTTTLILFYLLAMQVFFSWETSGYDTFLVFLLLGGFCSGIGIFARWKWSWTTMLAKSAMIMLMGLSLLNHTLNSTTFPAKLGFAEISYLLFIAAELVVVFVALRQPLREYLGVGNKIRPSFPVIFGGLLCVFSGVLLILLRISVSAQGIQALVPSGATVFGSMTDVTILCGVGIAIGGVLILLRTYSLGILVSVIFGLFPVPTIPGYPNYHAYHLFDLIYNMHPSPLFFAVAIIVDVLPIIGAAVALLSVRKTRG